jgi:hypothetical protein
VSGPLIVGRMDTRDAAIVSHLLKAAFAPTTHMCMP